MSLPKGFPKITVEQIFNLVDWNCDTDEEVEIRPYGESYTWFTIPACEMIMLSDDVLNRYVEALSGHDNKVCIWLSEECEGEDDET